MQILEQGLNNIHKESRKEMTVSKSGFKELFKITTLIIHDFGKILEIHYHNFPFSSC